MIRCRKSPIHDKTLSKLDIESNLLNLIKNTYKKSIAIIMPSDTKGMLSLSNWK